MPSEIFEALKIGEVEQIELEELLMHFFGRSRSDGERRWIFEREELPALEVTFTKTGKISDILPMPAFRNNDLERLAALVDAELVQERPWQIGRSVLFAKRPVTGYFRDDTKFQMLPVPEDAPRPDRPFWSDRHPFLFEFCFRKQRRSKSEHDPQNSGRTPMGRRFERPRGHSGFMADQHS